MQRKRWLVAGGLAVLSMAAVILLLNDSHHDTAERLNTHVPVGDLFAVHDGTPYVWAPADHAAYRLPLNNSIPTVCFRLPDDLNAEPTFNIVNDSLIIAGARVVVKRHNLRTDAQPAFVGSGDISRQSELGDFLLGPARAGEHRTPINLSTAYQHQLLLWRFSWQADQAEPIALPHTLRSANVYFAGASSDAVYATVQTSGARIEVDSKAGRRQEYPPNQVLGKIDFASGRWDKIAANLIEPAVTVTDDTVCWSTPHRYPDTKRDIVCRTGNAAPKAIREGARTPHASDAVFPSGVWWLESTAKGERLFEKRTGQASAQVIEPPLRQSEADTWHALKLYHVKDRLYLLCDVQTKDAAAKPSSPNPDPNYTEDAPAKQSRYLIRLHPEKAGQADFWGETISLPEGSNSWAFDSTYLYFTCRETDQSLALTLQDLFSSSAPQRPIRNVLYRLPLP